jgi:hypothetical protein
MAESGDPGQVIASHTLQDERLLRREVREQRRLGHLRGLGDLVDSHRVEATFGEQSQRDRGDPLTQRNRPSLPSTVLAPPLTLAMGDNFSS